MDMHLVEIGRVRSRLTDKATAPKSEHEGAPDALVAINPAYAEALDDLEPGATVVLITWLDRADRSTLKVHPRGDPSRPLRGVFTTRSPDRPNPLGLHEVTIRSIDNLTLTLGPLEALDGTPVVDIKPLRTINDKAS
ncbi:MAG: tRNA (N6-threonylcarbamoyladenosine(37)-N6)-methyltransferase TrmO [Proteobacteria bacterium]|nr:tRNA (N6-threonylcarbamoyladenosine(37)-N6)-methyltransferase TrmO [Pseudomonadota bacterium]